MMPKEALLTLFDEDKTLLMVGSKGSGKTNSAAVFMETLVNLGYEIWTNIHFFKKENIEIAIEKNKLSNVKGHVYRTKPPEIHVASKLSDTLLGIVNSTSGGKAVFLDEAGIHASSSRATSKETNTIKDLNKIIRHFESCFVLLAQVEGDVPPNLRDKDCDYQLDMKKYSTFKRRLDLGVKREIKNPDTGKKYIDFPRVKSFFIPLSHFPCDGKFPTGFMIDIDLKEALDRLSEIEDSVEIMDKGKGVEVLQEMIEEVKLEKKNKKRKISKKELAFNIFKNGFDGNLKQLAKTLNISYDYAKHLHLEFKD
ncbi:MAG: hypothetical protein KGY50_05225 [Candidatus Thermoplasmatota archaeon]|nr:hypothetical protein [Candidatus Thermoplasmatota archaeon]